MADYVKIKIRRDTTANWIAKNPVLALGEIGADMTLHRIKVGDGVKTWTELPFSDEDIIDNLTSTRTDAALSANQGRALKNEIQAVVASGGVAVIDNLTSTSTTAALSANQGRVLKSEIEAIVSAGGTPVVDNLTSTSTTSALSANQGRVLKNEIDAIVASGGTPVIDNLTSTSATSALSANQGRVLNSKVDDIENKVDSFGTFGMGYSVDEFNGYGKPTKITFEDGVTANLTWSGTRLDKITSSTGETITMKYNTDGLITGRTVTR